jgi:hypothetical protein
LRDGEGWSAHHGRPNDHVWGGVQKLSLRTISTLVALVLTTLTTIINTNTTKVSRVAAGAPLEDSVSTYTTKAIAVDHQHLPFRLPMQKSRSGPHAVKWCIVNKSHPSCPPNTWLLGPPMMRKVHRQCQHNHGVGGGSRGTP